MGYMGYIDYNGVSIPSIGLIEYAEAYWGGGAYNAYLLGEGFAFDHTYLNGGAVGTSFYGQLVAQGAIGIAPYPTGGSFAQGEVISGGVIAALGTGGSGSYVRPRMDNFPIYKKW